MAFRISRMVLLTLLVSFSTARIARADQSQLETAITQHRMGTLTIQAEPGAEVRVRQLRHEFWFGAAISSGIFSHRADAQSVARYKQVFLENFNSAVTENALKWHAMERRRGEIDYSIVDAILDWTEENDVPLRGHNIFWGVSNRVQDWQKNLGDDELFRRTDCLAWASIFAATGGIPHVFRSCGCIAV